MTVDAAARGSVLLLAGYGGAGGGDDAVRLAAVASLKAGLLVLITAVRWIFDFMR